MARRTSGFLDEGSDSGDDVPSSGDERQPRRAPGFVPASKEAAGFVPASKKAPSFVSAGQAPNKDSDEAHDGASDGEAHDGASDDDAPVSFARRSLGAGLGAKLAATREREQKAAAPTPIDPAVPLSRTSGSGGFDPSAYLRQMGWTGGGLGKGGEGMVNPIEVQLRPNRAGVAFGGRREMTKQERTEERRRTGAPASSDDEAQDEPAHVKSSAWEKKAKQKKPSVVYRTYEEIVADAAAHGATGPVLDASGREFESVSAALAQHAVPTSESAQLPELRHNLRLLCDSSRDSLQKLARDGAAHLDRARWLQRDAEEASRRVERLAEEKGVLVSILDAVTQLSKAAQTAAALDDLAPYVDRLLAAQTPAMAALGLDEAVAGAMVPALRRELADWDPLAAPHQCAARIAQWLPILTAPKPGVMTPFESVLWNVWMPKIRYAFTAEWDAADPAPAIALVEAWKDILPLFLLENILEQLVIPKLQRAVREWTPRRSRVGLHVLLLPWLPLCERRLDTVLAEARQQWRSALTAWRVADGIPAELVYWKPVFPSKDWEALLLDKVVPALSKALRTQFVVNPASQDMSVLEKVLPWHAVLRESVMSRLLEVEFGTPFLRTLHQWLTQPDVRLDEVAAWYAFWRSWLPSEIVALPGMATVLMRALRLMNQAVDLGAERTRLPMPDTTPIPRAEVKEARKAPQAPPPTLEDVAFRTLVDEHARQRDLFILPQNKLEPRTGLALLRAAANIDGKHGVSFYIDDDVLFVAERDEYVPVSLTALLDRAAAS